MDAMRALPAGTVTFLFTDVEGSTRLLHALGDEYANTLAEHRLVLREAFTRHGGVEVDTQGDAFFVAFARASDALAAAREANEALRGPVRVRMGIHTGEPLVTEEGYVGIDVHRAARIAAAGHGGQLLLSQSTRDLVGPDGLRDLGEHRLKDLTAPERIYQLGESEFPPLKSLNQTNLPIQPNVLIGRDRELADVLGAVRAARLVTLTGPGGTGKTRLALQAAAELVDEFADGVWFVSLAPVNDPALLLPTVAATIGAPEEIVEHLRGKRMLLLLDNVEQLLPGAAPLIANLLAPSDVKLFVTSRERLVLQAEREYPVPALAVDEGVALFMARSSSVAPTAGSDEHVLEIVRRLDGLPLAIELAAARRKVMTPQQIAERLGRSLEFLTVGHRDAPERQRTLRAAIAWSYDLLTEAERQLFARLSVFPGSFDLEAAEAIADADIDAMQSLVEKSLLRRTQEERFFMLATIREFAAEALPRDDADQTRRAHAEFFVTLAERVDVESRTGDQPALFALLDADYANVRSALAWCRDAGEPALEVRLATALWPYWCARGHVQEGNRNLEEALARTDDPPPRLTLGHCLLRHLAGGETRQILADARSALAACEALGDEFDLARAWNLIGRLEASALGNVTLGEQAWERALEYAERGGYRDEKAESMGWLMVMAIFGPLPTDAGIARCKRFYAEAGDDDKVRAFAQVERAVLEAMRGNFDRARELLADGTRMLKALGLNVWAANNAQETFYVEMLAGRPDRAEAVLRESYETLREMGERGFLSTIAAFLAHALAAQGNYDEADRFTRLSEAAAASDDNFSQIMWRTARAKVLAARGGGARAADLARAALDLAESHPDQLNTQADALSDLAEVLQLLGSRSEARDCLERAALRYQRKGNLVALQRSRERLANVDPIG